MHVNEGVRVYVATQVAHVETEVVQVAQLLVQARHTDPLKKNPGTQLRQVVRDPEQVRHGAVQVQMLPLRTWPARQEVQVVALGEQVAQGLVQGVQVLATRTYPAEQAEQLKVTTEQAVQPALQGVQTPPIGTCPVTH
jgi:hypothetical protein